MPSTASGRVLVTGASGFVGRMLVERLSEAGYQVAAVGRRKPARHPAGVMPWHGADLRRDPLDPLVEGIDAVVHAAGVAHANAPEAVHRAVTVEGTRRLIAAMQRADVRRIVFVSSIRAQVGAFSDAIVEDDRSLSPTDSYGRAKRDAEELVGSSALSATILRPVLVADQGARGNLAALLRLARSPAPLPFATFAARRSLIARRALADTVAFALREDATIGRRFNVADADPLTLAEMLAILREAMGRPPRLFAVPVSLLRAGLNMLGRAEDFDRLARPLVVAADGLCRLGWSASETGRDALRRMARASG